MESQACTALRTFSQMSSKVATGSDIGQARRAVEQLSFSSYGHFQSQLLISVHLEPPAGTVWAQPWDFLYPRSVEQGSTNGRNSSRAEASVQPQQAVYTNIHPQPRPASSSGQQPPDLQ